MGHKFTDEEKIALYDKINQAYFDRNFGSMTKADFELLLFAEYLQHLIRHDEPRDDYAMSKALGLTQNRIRNFKEKAELKYPRSDFDWKKEFALDTENMKFDATNDRLKIMIQDVSVMNEVKNYIEEKGWYYDTSLTSKMLQITLPCFLEIFEDKGWQFTDKAKAKISAYQETLEDSDKTAVKDFLKDFTLDGLKDLMTNGSKIVLVDVLKMLSLSGIVRVIVQGLIRALEK